MKIVFWFHKENSSCHQSFGPDATGRILSPYSGVRSEVLVWIGRPSVYILDRKLASMRYTKITIYKKGRETGKWVIVNKLQGSFSNCIEL